MINNFTHAEENAVMVAVFWILDADSKWAANEKNYYFGLATKFGWTQQDLVSSSSMSQTTAKSVISNMPSDKRRLVSCLLQAAMFADGQMTFRKPAVDVFSSYVHEANVPGDVPVSEAINIAHQFVGC